MRERGNERSNEIGNKAYMYRQRERERKGQRYRKIVREKKIN